MNLQATLAALDAFVPSNEEHEDVARLQILCDALESSGQVQAATPALLRVFERHPHALLGAPGPLVHCIESCGLERFLPDLLSSFTARPTRMTLWMLDRCLRSDPEPASRRAIRQALETVRNRPDARALRDDVDELLQDGPA